MLMYYCRVWIEIVFVRTMSISRAFLCANECEYVRQMDDREREMKVMIVNNVLLMLLCQC